jgi:transposase
MIPIPSGVRVWLAVGRTDMRKGMNGLALQVQQVLGQVPHAGDLYVFRGARSDLIKMFLITDYPQPRNDGTNREHTVCFCEFER